MKVLKLAGNALAALCVASLLAIIALLVVLPRLQGGAALTVLSGSMTPTIGVGSMVVVRPIDPASVRPGDIITFQAASGKSDLITHRAVRIQLDTEPPSIITKGDANPVEDIRPVPFGAVRGKVWLTIPLVGTLGGYARGQFGMTLLLGIPTLMFMIGRIRVIREELRENSKTSSTTDSHRETDEPVRVPA